MKQKLLNLKRLRGLMLLAVMCVFGVGTAWGEETETILSLDCAKPAPTGTTSTALSSTADVATFLNSAADLSSPSNQITCSEKTGDVYKGKGSGGGDIPQQCLKIGKAAGSGSITFTIPNTYDLIDEVEITCYGWKTTSSISVNGGTSQTFSTAQTEMTKTFTFSSTRTIKIDVTSSAVCITEIVLKKSSGSTLIPSLSVSPTSIAFGDKAINTTNTETFDVTFANLTEDLTVSGFAGVTVSPTTINKTATSPQTVTVTYAPTEEGSISGNITISNADDEVSQSVAVTGSAYDPDNLTYYEKVTSTPSDWSGDYIFTGINNSTDYYALTGVSNNLGTTAAVAVADDGIASTSTTNAYKVTIAPTTNGYSLYMEGVGYLSYSGSKNELYASTNFAENTCEWTISFSNEVATIKNVGSDTRILQFNYNQGNPRFACYTSSQVKLTLFKFNDGTPSISADDVNITYDAISGSIAYTIENGVGGTTLQASTDAIWLTIGEVGETSVAFTCSANEATESRTATVTLTYGEITKNVIVTQAAAPLAYTTIPALFDAATSTATDVDIAFGGWVVSAVKGSNAYLTDNQGHGLIIYASGHGFEVGDVLTGTARCKLQLYRGSAELTELTSTTTGLSVAENGTVTAQNIVISELSGVNTGALVVYEGLTYNGTALVDGSNNTITPYSTLYSYTFESGKAYNVTGIYLQYNTTKELLPRSATDIEEVVDEREDAEIAFEPTTITITQDEQFDQPTFSNPNNVSVSFDTTNADVASWNNGLELGSSTGTATITATFEGDDDYLPATATLTVTVNENLHFAEVVIGSGVYQKIASMEELEAGKRYLIVYNDGVSEDAYVFDGITDKNIGSYKEGTISNNKIDNNTLAATPVVLQNASSGNWFIMEGDNYIAYTKPVGTTKNNNLFAVTSNVDGSAWAITETDITNAWNTERKLRFNTTNTQERFCAYLESGEQEDVILYKELPFTLNNYGYATLYYSDKAFIVPEGVTAKTYNESVEESTIYEAGDVIPANEAVVLEGTANAEVSLVTTTTNVTPDTHNALKGLDEAGTTVGTGKFYMLSAKNGKVGFYWGANGGIAFETAAHKAYLVIPASKAKEAYYLNDEVTGIQKIDNTLFSTHKVYNLNGQRVDKNYKGVVIVNGKKMINK